MRKTVAAVIALLLVGAAVWALVKSQRNYSYPYPVVTAEVARIASDSGVTITDERTVGSSLRTAQTGFLDRLSRRVSGKPPADDLEEYTLQDGPDTIRVSVYHSLGNVGLIEIRPDSPSSKHATALLSGLSASFPKLECQLEEP